MSKSIKKLKPLEIHFWEDFGRFGEVKRSQFGTKMGSNIGFPENKKKSLAELAHWLGLKSGGSKLGAKIDQKSIK